MQGSISVPGTSGLPAAHPQDSQPDTSSSLLSPAELSAKPVDPLRPCRHSQPSAWCGPSSVPHCGNSLSPWCPLGSRSQRHPSPALSPTGCFKAQPILLLNPWLAIAFRIRFQLLPWAPRDLLTFQVYLSLRDPWNHRTDHCGSFLVIPPKRSRCAIPMAGNAAPHHTGPCGASSQLRQTASLPGPLQGSPVGIAHPYSTLPWPVRCAHCPLSFSLVVPIHVSLYIRVEMTLFLHETGLSMLLAPGPIPSA